MGVKVPPSQLVLDLCSHYSIEWDHLVCYELGHEELGHVALEHRVLVHEGLDHGD